MFNPLSINDWAVIQHERERLIQILLTPPARSSRDPPLFSGPHRQNRPQQLPSHLRIHCGISPQRGPRRHQSALNGTRRSLPAPILPSRTAARFQPDHTRSAENAADFHPVGVRPLVTGPVFPLSSSGIPGEKPPAATRRSTCPDPANSTGTAQRPGPARAAADRPLLSSSVYHLEEKNAEVGNSMRFGRSPSRDGRHPVSSLAPNPLSRPGSAGHRVALGLQTRIPANAYCAACFPTLHFCNRP